MTVFHTAHFGSGKSAALAAAAAAVATVIAPSSPNRPSDNAQEPSLDAVSSQSPPSERHTHSSVEIRSANLDAPSAPSLSSRNATVPRPRPSSHSTLPHADCHSADSNTNRSADSNSAHSADPATPNNATCQPLHQSTRHILTQQSIDNLGPGRQTRMLSSEPSLESATAKRRHRTDTAVATDTTPVGQNTSNAKSGRISPRSMSEPIVAESTSATHSSSRTPSTFQKQQTPSAAHTSAPVPAPVPTSASNPTVLRTKSSTLSQQFPPPEPPSAVFERNALVKSLFGTNVGTCIAEFPVAYNHVMGRLFVASRAILYHCNIFGFERRLCLQYRDVTQIQAYRTTSLRISMVDCEEYVFKKFTNHRLVATWLQTVLAAYRIKYPPGNEDHISIESNLNVNDPPADTNAIDNNNHNHNPSEQRPHLQSETTVHDTLPSDHQIQVRPRSQSVPTFIQPPTLPSGEYSTDTLPPLSPQSTATEDEHDARVRSSTLSKDQNVTLSTLAELQLPKEPQPRAAGAADPATKTDTTTITAMSQPTATSSTEEQSMWKTVREPLEEIILDSVELCNCTTSQFFNQFLADDAMHAVTCYQVNSIGDKNMEVAKWKHSGDGVRERHIQFDHPLNSPIGPSHARTKRKQTLWSFSSAMVLQNDTIVQGIPAADCFQLQDRWVVASVSETSVTLTVSFQITFVKRTMLRSMIQRSIRQETRKWYDGFLKKVRDALRKQQLALEASSEERQKEAKTVPSDDHVPRETADTIKDNNVCSSSSSRSETVRVPCGVIRDSRWVAVVVVVAVVVLGLIVLIMIAQLMLLQQTLWLCQKQLEQSILQNERLLELLEDQRALM